MDFGKDRLFFRKKLREIMDDAEQIEAVCAVYDETMQCAAKERKIKQMEGIRKAKEEGKTLGRPRLKEPEGFREVVRLWSQKRMNVHDAAQLCGMGVSTFYRRVNDLRTAAEEREGEGNEALEK